mgnify:CR=1 FL=1
MQGYNFLILKMLNNRISDDSEGDDVVEITGTLVDDGASADYSRLSITTSPVNYMFMLRRLCKAVSNPDFSEAELQRAREQTLNRMGEGGGTSDQLYDIFLSCFYRLHPYKRSPQVVPVILKRATAADVSAYFKNNFTPVVVPQGRLDLKDAPKSEQMEYDTAILKNCGISEEDVKKYFKGEA